MHAGFGFRSTFSLEPIVQDDLRVFAWERSSKEPLGKQSLNGSQIEIIRGLGSRPAHGKEDGIVVDEGGVVSPIFNNYVWITTTTVEHGPMSGARPNDGQKAMERWWFA